LATIANYTIDMLSGSIRSAILATFGFLLMYSSRIRVRT